MKYYVCIEIGGTNFRYGLVSEQLDLVEFKILPTKLLAQADNQIDFLVERIEELTDKVDKRDVVCVSMALASLMDKKRTSIYSSPMVPGFENIPIVEILEERVSLPVIIEKDVNTLLVYEMHKKSIEPEGITIGVYLGTGLGNAMCIDGKVYKGNTGTACELGHIPVIGNKGDCGCGKKGCIELYSSGNRLVQLAEMLSCDVPDIFEKHQDSELIAEFIEATAIAIATEITILDPVSVILGGGVFRMKGFPMENLQETIKGHLRAPNPRESVQFAFDSGDSEAGVVGAAIHASKTLG